MYLAPRMVAPSRFWYWQSMFFCFPQSVLPEFINFISLFKDATLNLIASLNWHLFKISFISTPLCICLLFFYFVWVLSFSSFWDRRLDHGIWPFPRQAFKVTDFPLRTAYVYPIIFLMSYFHYHSVKLLFQFLLWFLLFLLAYLEIYCFVFQTFGYFPVI